MPGVQLEREQLVTAVEAPLAPSEEAEIDAAAANANFGPQDVPIVLPEHNEIAPANNVVYNVLVDMPNAIPAAFDEVGGSATYSDDAYETEQEWDMSNASAATHTTIVEQQPGVPEAPADAQPPPVQTRSGRQVQRQDFYSP